jgi:hypothetical protein
LLENINEKQRLNLNVKVKMKYYFIRNKQMPWGDYGNTLFRGFLNVMDKNYNDLEIPTIERTGPFVPEIYIANSRDLVVSDKVRQIFEDNQISGILNYKKIGIKKIVNIDWQKWDKNRDPEFFPKNDEPENYILKGKHDENLVKFIPSLYNPIIQERKILKVVSDKKDYQNFTHLELNEKLNEDIICSGLRLIVSEKFKNLLETDDINDIQYIELKYNPS